MNLYGTPSILGTLERESMKAEKIVRQIEPSACDSFSQTPKAKDEPQSTDLKALRDSLNMKRQLLTLLEKGDYIRNVDPIKANIDRAISDLNEIIKAFPDEDFLVTT